MNVRFAMRAFMIVTIAAILGFGATDTVKAVVINSNWTPTSGNWSDSTKWSGAAVPTAAQDIANYVGANITSATTVDVAETAGEIRWGGAAGALMGTNKTWTISPGSNLTMDNGGLNNSISTPGALIQAFNTSTGNTIAALIISGGTLALNDDLTVVNRGTASTGNTIAAPIQISSVITGNHKVTFGDNTVGANFPVQLPGTSGNRQAVSITGTNTFTGNVTIAKGLVVTNNAAGFGDSANIITIGVPTGVTNSAIMLQGNIAIPNNIVIPAGIANFGIIGTQVASPSTAGSFTGTISVGSGSRIQFVSLSGTGLAPLPTEVGLTVSGVISGAGGLEKSGGSSNNGVVTLGDLNTYSGETRIPKGLLRVTSLNSVSSPVASSSLGRPTTIADGTIAVGAAAGGLVYLGAGETSDRNVDIQSATAGIVSSLYASGTGPLVLTGNVDVTIGAVSKTLNLSGTNTGNNTISGNIQNTLASSIINVTKTDVGKWILGGSNSYSGTTAVSAGTLLVNGINSGNGAVTVTAGATLGGTGSLGSSVVTVNGTLSPGASIESLLAGAVNLNAGSSFSYELDSTAPTGDLLVANGALTIDPAAALSLTDLNPGVAAVGTKLTLINYSGTLTGTFNGLANGATISLGANTWMINYSDAPGATNFSGDQTLANFVTLTAVPEPNALLLFGIGFVGLAIHRKWLQAKLV